MRTEGGGGGLQVLASLKRYVELTAVFTSPPHADTYVTPFLFVGLRRVAPGKCF